MDQTGGNDPSETGAPDQLAELGAWAAEARADAVIDQRRRAVWLRRQAAEEATMAGVLIDLAERGRAVSLHTVAGHHHRGRITLVGRDVVGVVARDALVTLVRLDAVATVRPQPGSLPVTGDGPLDLTTTLRRELSELHHDRERTMLTLRGGETMTGALDTVGHDVIAMTTDGGGQAYIPLDSVLEVSVPESG